MKIIPKHNILILGRHCEAGVAVEIAEPTAKAMIEQGFALRAPADETEAAAAKPAGAETAAVAPGTRKKKSV